MLVPAAPMDPAKGYARIEPGYFTDFDRIAPEFELLFEIKRAKVAQEVAGSEAVDRDKGSTWGWRRDRYVPVPASWKPGAFWCVRLCIYLQYCMTREATNAFDIKRFKGDPIRYLAMRHSARTAVSAEVTAPHQMES
jgi:hypothetical protein